MKKFKNLVHGLSATTLLLVSSLSFSQSSFTPDDYQEDMRYIAEILVESMNLMAFNVIENKDICDNQELLKSCNGDHYDEVINIEIQGKTDMLFSFNVNGEYSSCNITPDLARNSVIDLPCQVQYE